jgi:hypothetical protein
LTTDFADCTDKKRLLLPHPQWLIRGFPSRYHR